MQLKIKSKIKTKKKLSDGTYSIDRYIKKSLINKTILLFFISVIPLTLSLIYTYKHELDSNTQKAKLAFEANQNIIMNKIDSSIKQIAHANGFRLFLQSSENSRKRDKYKLLTNIEILLLHNPLIEGIEMYTNSDKQVLHNGKKSDLSVKYDLVYTNDFIDQYGEKFGYLKVYLDKDTILSQLGNNYYKVEQSSSTNNYLIDFNKLNTNLIHIIENQRVSINPKHVISTQWLYFLSTLILLLFSYIVIARRTFNKIIEPIKNIETSIFSNKYNNRLYDSNIRELVWINKIISNIKTSKQHMRNKLTSLYKKNNDFTVNSLHYLKSSLTSSKLIIDEELKNHPAYKDLNKNLVKTISKIANTIHQFKSANDRFDDHEAVLTNTERLEDIIKKELEKYTNIRFELILNSLDPNTFIPLSKKQLSHTISNILTNAIESGATSILVKANHDNANLTLVFENNGAPIDLNKAECYISGSTSKANGTGTGLSSIHKLLINNNSQMCFSKPSEDYSTKLTLEISTIDHKLNNVIEYVMNKIILSEIIIFNQPDILLPTKIENNLVITNISHEKNLLVYIDLSNKSGIIENQLYVHDYKFYMTLKGSKYLRAIIDENNDVMQLI